MTPLEKAKLTVAGIFLALRAFPEDAIWQERVRGGYHAEAGITGGRLVADVSSDGSFAVYAGKPDPSCENPLKPGAICLISGSCAAHVAMQASNRPEDEDGAKADKMNDGAQEPRPGFGFMED